MSKLRLPLAKNCVCEQVSAGWHATKGVTRNLPHTYTSTVSTPFVSLAVIPSSLASSGSKKDLCVTEWQ